MPGSMRDNPYKASDIGITVNDIRIKIQKTIGIQSVDVLEILVENKILAPKLLIEDVWTKIWSPKHLNKFSDQSLSLFEKARLIPPMKTVYRLIGVDGEATEDHIETFSSQKGMKEDPEKVFRIA